MRRRLAVLLVAGCAFAARSDDVRLKAVQDEIARLRVELDALRTRESGVLGDLTRLDAELRLREAELSEATLKLATTESALAERDDRLHRLEVSQAERERYLSFRVRELYKAGPRGDLASVLGEDGGGDYLRAVRYAAFLSERDARLLREYRADRERVGHERSELAAEQARYDRIRRDAAGARQRLSARRAERAGLLESIQNDRVKRQEALGELEGASKALGRLVQELGGGPGRGPVLDVRKFRGLLDWPAAGRVATPFGSAVHPRFKTVIPHPGIELQAPPGADFRAVFDGRVVYASTLHGYGLTAIVDHGNGVLSVYTHAAVLLVSPGQEIARNEVLGKVGDTGSLKGPGLYFEIREGGKPVDPAAWLRRR